MGLGKSRELVQKGNIRDPCCDENILYLDSKYFVSWLCNLGSKITADGD